MQWSENAIYMVDLTAERVKLERVMDQKCHKMGLNKTKYIRVLMNHYKLKSIIEENIDDYKKHFIILLSCRDPSQEFFNLSTTVLRTSLLDTDIDTIHRTCINKHMKTINTVYSKLLKML